MVQGAVLVFLVIGLSVLAYRNRELPKTALFILLFLGLVLRVWVAADPFLHEWDERYHALVAKNLLADPTFPCLLKNPLLPFDFRDWSSNHVWLHKPPLALWTAAASLKVFGVNEFALRLPSVIVSLLSLFLTFKIFEKLYDARLALLATFFQTINGLVIEIAGGRVATDHLDTMFLFWIELGVFLIVAAPRKFGRIWLSAVVGLAILTKWLPALLLPALYFFHQNLFQKNGFSKKIGQTLLVVALGLAVAAPWFWYTFVKFPAEFLWENGYNFRHLSENLEGHERAWWYFLDSARIHWNEAIYAAAAFWIWNLWRRKSAADFFITCWIGLPLLVFSFSSTKMPGYLLVASPAIFAMLAVFVRWLWTLESSKFQKIGKLTAAVVVLLALRYCFERVKPFEKQTVLAARKLEMQVIKNAIATDANNCVVFGWHHPVEGMFFSEGVFYGFLPDVEHLQIVQQRGSKVFVIDNGNLSESLKHSAEVIKIKFEK